MSLADGRRVAHQRGNLVQGLALLGQKATKRVAKVHARPIQTDLVVDRIQGLGEVVRVPSPAAGGREEPRLVGLGIVRHDLQEGVADRDHAISPGLGLPKPAVNRLGPDLNQTPIHIDILSCQPKGLLPAQPCIDVGGNQAMEDGEISQDGQLSFDVMQVQEADRPGRLQTPLDPLGGIGVPPIRAHEVVFLDSITIQSMEGFPEMVGGLGTDVPVPDPLGEEGFEPGNGEILQGQGLEVNSRRVQGRRLALGRFPSPVDTAARDQGGAHGPKEDPQDGPLILVGLGGPDRREELAILLKEWGQRNPGGNGRSIRTLSFIDRPLDLPGHPGITAVPGRGDRAGAQAVLDTPGSRLTLSKGCGHSLTPFPSG